MKWAQKTQLSKGMSDRENICKASCMKKQDKLGKWSVVKGAYDAIGEKSYGKKSRKWDKDQIRKSLI